jgi:hypothetical protein
VGANLLSKKAAKKSQCTIDQVHRTFAYFSRRVTALRMEAPADANNTDKSAFSRLMGVTISPQLATREELKELSTNLIY